MMTDIDPITGLPRDISAFENIAREAQYISISVTKRRYGKLMTLVEGFDPKSIDIVQLMKKLKSKFACGGTAKGNVIELQGNHLEGVRKELVAMGFSEDSISVKERKK